MWETIGKALKVVFEKQLIPAVISVVAAIGVLLFLPADYWAITKLGKPLFLIFVAGGVFLLLDLIINLARKCGYFHAARKTAKENQRYEKAKELEKMRELWRNVDGLSPENRNLIKELLKTDNKPIKIENTIFPYDSFLESDWFNSTEIYEPDTDLKPNHISVSPVGSVPPYCIHHPLAIPRQTSSNNRRSKTAPTYFSVVLKAGSCPAEQISYRPYVVILCELPLCLGRWKS